MEIILLRDMENLGYKGDVVQVRDGFARNFLIPRKLGLAATRENQLFVKEQKVRAQKRSAKRKQEAETRAKELHNLKVTLPAAAGEHDKLYGSITTEDIAQALAAKGFSFDKRKIHLSSPIRSLGNFNVTIELYPEVKTSVAVEIVRKD